LLRGELGIDENSKLASRKVPRPASEMALRMFLKMPGLM
jgi:hypothetical protein